MNTARPRNSGAFTTPIEVSSSSPVNAFMLFVVGLSLAGSGFSMLRFQFMGLSVHPYLVVVGAFFPILAVTRLHFIPSQLLMEMFGFAALYFATTIPGGVSAGEGIKMFTGVATIITMAMLVRSWKDFTAGTLGMCIGIGVLAIRGLESDTAGTAMGVEAMDATNRNAYSLYALPVLLLGTYVIIRGKPDTIITKVLIGGSILVSALAIILSLNRSGWLGLGIIALMMMREKSLKAAFVLAIIGGIVGALILTLYSSDAVETRMRGTQTSKSSDSLRWSLFVSGMQIGFENPLIGVSPQELPFELARRLGSPEAYVSPHNMYAHVAGGSGLVALALLLHIGYVLATRRPSRPLHPAALISFKDGRKIMRLLLVLWFIRAMFTNEIIYSPGFCMAIGLALGLELSSESISFRMGPSKLPRQSYGRG